MNRRIILFMLVFGGLFAALTVRLFYLQIVQHPRLSRLALRQQERTLEVQAGRGAIYDRQGRPLALNIQSQSFFAIPTEIRDPRRTAEKLAPCTGLSAARLEQRLRSRKGFVWIQRKLPEAQAQAIRDLKLAGVYALAEPKRVYPEGRLASHVLGFVGLDNQGLAGIELQYDRAIRGRSGWQRVTQDARGRRIATSARMYKPPEPGQDIHLTLDKVIQHVAERELERGIAAARARAGSVIVMAPATGEILALANKPDYDPNRYNRFSAAARRNRAVHDVYEPGSTFKLVTAAAALEEACYREGDIIDCANGHAVFNGLAVRDHEPRGRITFRDVIAFSSNIGCVKIGQRLGTERMAHYVREFGFGAATGIALPGEANGLVKAFDKWQRWNMVSIPFGQGLAVTPLQLTTAYAAVAHEGLLPRPWIVKSLQQPGASPTLEGRPEMRRRVISADTARRLREVLTAAVERGTGAEAGLANYRVAGKTGTAQKPLPRGGYDPRYHVASFVGFLPADQPEVLVAVIVDEPEGTQWGGQIAGPVFREISRELVAYLGIAPDRETPEPAVAAAPAKTTAVAPKPAPQAALVRVPDVTGLAAGEAAQRLETAGLQAVSLGAGPRVMEQRPAAGGRLNPDSKVVLYRGDGQEAVVVPNLAGLSVRNALQILNDYGLQARISGTGVVARQAPRPHALARIGQICSLHCQDPEALRP